ncbi:MAG: YggT family protein [Halioglobus sp.]
MSALNEIFGYLIQTVTSLYLLAMLLRFILQLVRADFYNPICQFLVKITNPLVLPVRRIVPGVAGLDLASLLLSIALQFIAILALLMINSMPLPNPLLLLLWSLIGVVALLVNIYFFALLGMIILSWVAAGSKNPAIYLLHQITEPVMAPFRKALPSMGGLDFSPIVLFILINITQIALRHVAASVGMYGGLVLGL